MTGPCREIRGQVMARPVAGAGSTEASEAEEEFYDAVEEEHPVGNDDTEEEGPVGAQLRSRMEDLRVAENHIGGSGGSHTPSTTSCDGASASIKVEEHGRDEGVLVGR